MRSYRMRPDDSCSRMVTQVGAKMGSTLTLSFQIVDSLRLKVN